LLTRCFSYASRRVADDAAAFCNGGRRGEGCLSRMNSHSRKRRGYVSVSFAQIHPRARLGEESGLREPNIAFRAPRRRGVFARSDGWALCLRLRGGEGCYDALRKQRSGFLPAVSLFFLVFPPVSGPSIFKSKGYPSQLGKPIRF